MTDYKISELKGALSNTIGSVGILSNTVNTEKLRTKLIIKKLEDITKSLKKIESRVTTIEGVIEKSKKTTKQNKKNEQKNISIDN